MRIGGTVAQAPVVRRQSVAAGGGETPAPTMAADSFKATAAQSAPVSAQSAPAGEKKGLDLQAMTVRAQSFLSNIWDSVIAPFFKGLLGMVGINL
ncbi:hypothetical protein J7643_10500 [bacterium]|nr:hypothetical protein [bacterium]